MSVVSCQSNLYFQTFAELTDFAASGLEAAQEGFGNEHYTLNKIAQYLSYG